MPQALEIALQQHQNGSLADAEVVYRQLLGIDSDYFDALHLLGVLLHQTGDHQQAASLISKALQLNRLNAAAWNNLGEVYRAMNRQNDAKESYQQAILLKPDYAEAYSNLGGILHELGKPEEAETACRRAISIRPNHAEAWLNLGNLHRAAKRLSEAESAYQQALTIKPGYAEAYNNLGNLLGDSGRMEAAEEAYRTAITIIPTFAEVYSNLGALVRRQGRLEEALALCRTAVELKPSSHLVQCNLGNVHRSTGSLEAALAAFHQALDMKPDYAEGYSDFGNILRDLGRFDEAECAYQKALFIKPDFAEALNNLGTVLKDLGRLEEAVAAYRQAIVIRPDMSQIHSNLLLTLTYCSIDDESLFREHLQWGEPFNTCNTNNSLLWPNTPLPDRRLRIGYLSADLGRHPVGYFLLPVLKHHDHHHFEIFCYSIRINDDDHTGRLRHHADTWRNAAGLDDAGLEALIRQDGIDILIDLAGHTAQNSLTVFARKPAPVQVSWLGYWTTTGLSAMDYVFTDRASVIPEAEQFFSEKLVFLPDCRFCYTPPDDAPELAPLPMLHNGFVTFGSFNNITKVSSDVITNWAGIVREVEQSRLILKWHALADSRVREQIHAAFEEYGIARERIELRKASPHAELLKEYADIDIALDPFPFSGGLTSCEALWMGVPVVTLPGSRPASRQTFSFLSAIGLEQFAAYDTTQYVDIAAQLAGNPALLTDLRKNLRERLARSPLCDADRFTRNLESAFRTVWKTWCEDTSTNASRS